MEQLRSKFEKLMDAPITELQVLAVNKYCRIVQGVIGGEPVVMKEYHAGEHDLVRREADGIRLYEKLAIADDRSLPGRALALDEDQRLLVMTFVRGRRLSDIIRESAKDRARWSHAEGLLRLAGEFLRALRARTTLNSDLPDSFHEEYILHCSGKLRGLNLFGGFLFATAPEEAKALWDHYRLAGTPPSTAHGDFVLRNLHVDGDRIGVIDFANTLANSHPLNDLTNMRQGMEAMWLPREFVERLWRAMQEGFGTESFPEADHAFFHEFHRRRWLMLNLGSRQPVRWIKALRGLRSFARPWETRRRSMTP